MAGVISEVVLQPRQYSERPRWI